MSDIDAMLQARASAGTNPGVDQLLAQRASGATAPAGSAPTGNAADASAGKRFETGLGDLEFGLGQAAEHVAEKPLNWIRAGLRGVMRLGGASADTANQVFEDKSADDFDKIVQTREQDYQAARQAAGQTGIDWWRLGGQAANPLNYLAPGGAAESAAGRVVQGAAQGAVVNAAQPDANAPGSFWWDKAKSAGIGALGGGVASGLIEAASPLLKVGVKYIRGIAPNAGQTTAADSVVNEALRAKGVDPASVDLNVLSGMRKEVRDALSVGAEPSDEAIVNRAIAESLPVPIQLMRGQATRDAKLFTKEQNLRGVDSVGEPITARLTHQNEAMLGNLDALGAKNALNTVDAGNKIQSTVQGLWDTLQQHKTALYNAVKNSQGLSARVDGESAGREIRETLGSPQAFHAWAELPKSVQETIHDMEDGTLPLTASNVMALDKKWGQLASATPEASHAINQARQILGKADISDDIGQDAMKAYQAAKQAHAQQVSLLEPKLLNDRPNPNYQPLVKAVVQDGKPPETLFQTHFMGAAPSVAKGNLEFLGDIDPATKPMISNTLMGEIKRAATNNASESNPPVSEAVLRGWTTPVQSARLEALTSPAQAQTFKNLAHTAEVAKRPPVASAVNTSNTGSAVINAAGSFLKSSASAQIAKRLPLVQRFGEAISGGAKEAAEQTAAKEALSPGVTLKSLMTATPKQAATRRLLSRLVVPTTVAAYAADKQKPQPPEE